MRRSIWLPLCPKLQIPASPATRPWRAGPTSTLPTAATARSFVCARTALLSQYDGSFCRAVVTWVGPSQRDRGLAGCAEDLGDRQWRASRAR